MTTVENLPSPEAERPIGFGRLKRKEDERFIRGQGTYLDDIELPGMVHGAVLRSPYAHAKIVSIDTSRGARPPECRRGRHRQGPGDARPRVDADHLLRHPGRPGRRQGPLSGPGGRLRASPPIITPPTTPCALIDVEYEPLPAVVNARKALDPDAPLIRDDKSGQRDNLASPLWEAGDEAATDRAFAEADTIVSRDIIYPRCHPAPLETCGIIADFNPDTGQLDIYNGNQAPHAHRTVYAHVAGLAEHMIRIRCNDIGGGFGNKVPIYPGLRLRDRRLDRGRRAGQVGREPLREPDVDRLRARLHHAWRDLREGRQGHRSPGRHDRRSRRLRQHRSAHQVPGRVLPHRLRLLRPRRRSRQGQGRLHEQGAGRGRVPLLVPNHRGRLPRRAHGRRARARDRDRSDRPAHEQLHPAGAVPVRDRHGLDLRLRRVREDDEGRDGDRGI